MGRAKQRMELISNEKSRYVTFQKRKKGLKKKTYELQTLCDVEVCLIIYGPNTDERADLAVEEIWPENPETIHRLIDSYKNQSSEDRVRRTLNLSNFFMDRNQKIEDTLVKLRKRNDEATYSTWDDRYSNLSKEQLRELECILDGKLQDVKARVALIKGSSHPQTTQNPACFVQGFFGTRNMQWENVHDHHHYHHHHQQPPPISMMNLPRELDVPIHYPFDHEIQQGQQVDASYLMENKVMMMPMNYGNNQVDGMSTSNFICNHPLERPICSYDPLMSGMLESVVYNNSAHLPVGYCNPNMETMLPYVQYYKMASESSPHIDKYYKPTDLETNNQN